MIEQRVNEKFRGLINLTRIKEWWLISFSFIIFAYVPHIYRLYDTMRLEYIINLFTSPPVYLTIIIVFSGWNNSLPAFSLALLIARGGSKFLSP